MTGRILETIFRHEESKKLAIELRVVDRDRGGVVDHKGLRTMDIDPVGRLLFAIPEGKGSCVLDLPAIVTLRDALSEHLRKYPDVMRRPVTV